MPSAIRVASVLLLAAVASGCASNYQPGSGSGYSETQLQPDVVDVRFGGNRYTSMERAADFLMLRCAEVTLEQGFTHFAVLAENSDSRVSTHTSITSVGANTRVRYEPQTMARIKLLKSMDDGAFDATYLRESLRAKYGL